MSSNQRHLVAAESVQAAPPPLPPSSIQSRGDSENERKQGRDCDGGSASSSVPSGGAGAARAAAGALQQAGAAAEAQARQGHRSSVLLQADARLRRSGSFAGGSAGGGAHQS